MYMNIKDILSERLELIKNNKKAKKHLKRSCRGGRLWYNEANGKRLQMF